MPVSQGNNAYDFDNISMMYGFDIKDKDNNAYEFDNIYMMYGFELKDKNFLM